MTMIETEFKFKNQIDINEHIKQIGESLAEQVGSDPLKVKCKGVRFYFVNEDDMLMQMGMFAENFSPESWDD